MQLMICIRASLLGIGWMIGYDLLRAIRRNKKRQKSPLQDLLFCCAAMVSFWLFILLKTDGRLRGYLLLGLAGGMLFWRKTVSPLETRLFSRAFRLLHRAGMKSGKAAIRLFQFPRGN